MTTSRETRVKLYKWVALTVIAIVGIAVIQSLVLLAFTGQMTQLQGGQDFGVELLSELQTQIESHERRLKVIEKVHRRKAHSQQQGGLEPELPSSSAKKNPWWGIWPWGK